MKMLNETKWRRKLAKIANRFCDYQVEPEKMLGGVEITTPQELIEMGTPFPNQLVISALPDEMKACLFYFSTGLYISALLDKDTEKPILTFVATTDNDLIWSEEG